MHELTLALNILKIAGTETSRRGDAVVRAIHVRIGPLSGVVTEALVSAFDAARAGTPFAETRLIVEDVPIRVYCETCQGAQLAESLQSLCCARCGRLSGRIVSGDELELASLEMQT